MVVDFFDPFLLILLYYSPFVWCNTVIRARMVIRVVVKEGLQIVGHHLIPLNVRYSRILGLFCLYNIKAY